MPKDPAFLFYPSDFNDGTQDFTNEEVGAYIRLLMFQFSQGHLPIDRIKRKLGGDFERLWPILESKFKIDEEGMLYNARLDVEVSKRKAFTESRRENAKKRYAEDKEGTSSAHADAHAGHMPEHMGNENENGNKDENAEKASVSKKREKKPFIPPTLAEVQLFFAEKGFNDSDLAKKAYLHYADHNWKDSKGNQVQNWKQKMQTNWISGRTPALGYSPATPMAKPEFDVDLWEALPPHLKGYEFYVEGDPSNRKYTGNHHFYQDCIMSFPGQNLIITRRYTVKIS